jgi:GNAT superfamily N-acetyltransferase
MNIKRWILGSFKFYTKEDFYRQISFYKNELLKQKNQELKDIFDWFQLETLIEIKPPFQLGIPYISRNNRPFYLIIDAKNEIYSIKNKLASFSCDIYSFTRFDRSKANSSGFICSKFNIEQKSCYIEKIVSLKHQREGLGSYLIHLIENLCLLFNITKIMGKLPEDPPDMDMLINFYTKNGFVIDLDSTKKTGWVSKNIKCSL